MNVKALINPGASATAPHITVTTGVDGVNPVSAVPSTAKDGFPFEGDWLHVQGVIEGGGGGNDADLKWWGWSAISGKWGALFNDAGVIVNTVTEDAGGLYQINHLPGVERIYVQVTTVPVAGTLKLWFGRTHGG